MYEKTKQTIKIIVEKLLNNDYDFRWIFVSCIGYNLIKVYAKTFDKNLLDFIFDESVDWFLNEIGFYDDNFKLSNYNTQKRITPIYSIVWFWEVEKISNNFYDRLKIILWTEYQSIIVNLSNAIFELLNNIEHHSWADLWEIANNFSSAQIYLWKWFLQIAIVDTGIWILSSVRKKDKNIQTADKAILKALERWFTWKTQLINQWHHNKWLWLTRTKEIIKQLKWDLFIWTRDYLYCYSWQNDKEEFLKFEKSWRWTYITINIYYDKIWKIDENPYNLDWNNLDDLFI